MTTLAPINYPFNVEGIDPYVGGASTPLPAGKYVMEIAEMEVRANRDASTGHNLSLVYSVLDGEFKGRKFYEALNLWHTGSSAAVEIANKQLSSIGHAVGILSGNDPTALAFKPMHVELELTEAAPDKINENTGETVKGRGPQNRVVKREAYQAAQAVPNVAAAPAAAAQAPAFAPAAQPAQAAATAAAPAAQAPAAQAPAFAPAAAQAPAAAAPAGGAPVAPPWQK